MNNHGRNRKHNRRHHYVTKFPYIVHFWIQWLKNAVSEKETVQKNKGDQRNKTDPNNTTTIFLYKHWKYKNLFQYKKPRTANETTSKAKEFLLFHKKYTQVENALCFRC